MTPVPSGRVARPLVALAAASALLLLTLPVTADEQATRFDEVRGGLERERFLDLDAEGSPVRQQVDLTMVYEMDHRRDIGGSREKVNLYITRGAVAVPYPPEAVVELLTAFDGYKTWALDGVNDLELHPDFPRVRSWNFDINGIGPTKRYPGFEIDVSVFKFGRGSVPMRERERHDGGAASPSVIHLGLGGKNLFVKHFTFTFFVFPLNDGRATAIRFENECGLRSVVDWFFREANADMTRSTQPRVARFLQNVVAELARRAEAEDRAADKPTERPRASF